MSQKILKSKFDILSISILLCYENFSTIIQCPIDLIVFIMNSSFTYQNQFHKNKNMSRVSSVVANNRKSEQSQKNLPIKFRLFRLHFMYIFRVINGSLPVRPTAHSAEPSK